MDCSVAAVICAAGSSSRMGGGGLKKEYRILKDCTDGEGKPLTVLGAALRAFADAGGIGLALVVVPPGAENGEFAARSCIPAGLLAEGAEPRLLFVPGGPTRRASVHHALSLLAAYNPSYVLIHDGGRPWVDAELIQRIIAAVRRFGAVIPALPPVETPKEIDEAGFITRHLSRARVVCAQTPQAFAFPAILRAHEKAAERELREHIDYTDDAAVWGEFEGPVAVIPGSPANRKITFPEDLL